MDIRVTKLNNFAPVALALVLASCGGAGTGEEPLPTVPPSVPPATPGLAVSSDTAITIDWNSVADATYYDVFRHTTNDSTMATGPITDSSQATTSFTDTGLSARTQYYYWIRACNPTGCSELSSSASATTVGAGVNPRIPAVPAAPSFTVVDFSTVAISWTEVLTATYYQVFRNGIDDSGSAAEQTEGMSQNTTSLNSGNLIPQIEYYFWVKACNNIGCSAFSPSTTTAIGPDTRPPPVPSRPGLVVNGDSSITVNWTAMTEATYYQVFRNGVNDSESATELTEGVLQTAPTYSSTGLTPATQYFYWIKACNDNDCSAFSTVATATTPIRIVAPGAPSPPTLSVVNDVAITVSWTLVDNTDYYQVFRNRADDSSMATKLTADMSHVALTFDDTGLMAQTQYYYWVKACNSVGCSPFSTAANATTDLAIPGPPRLVVLGSSSIEVRWDAVPMATYYQVFRNSVDDSSMATELTTAMSLNIAMFEDTDLVAETQYYYWIKACNTVVNTGGCSVFSAGANATTIAANVDPGTPGAPTLIIDSGTAITVEWAMADNAIRYEVFRHTTNDSSMATELTSEGSPLRDRDFEDTGLTENTQYYYWIKACNDDRGCSAFGPSANATTAPSPPATLTLIPNSDSEIVASWTAVTTATYYQVFRHSETDSATADSSVAVSLIMGELQTGDNLTNIALSGGTRYFYWVKACNASGCSAFSNSATTITRPGAPATPALVIDSSTQVSLEWSAVTGATRYEVHRDIDDNLTGAQVLSSTLTAVTYTDSTLTADVEYFYWIRACNTSGCSVFSGSATSAQASLSEALEIDQEFTQPNTQSRTADWRSQTDETNDGVDAAESGTISVGGSSCLQTSVTGPGLVGFYWKVDSEAGSNYLNFSVGDVEQLRVSGDVDWQQQKIRISTSEATTVEWCYNKNADAGTTADKGYLDQVSFAPSQLSIQPGFLRFTWNAVESTTNHYRLQSSIDGGTTYTTVPEVIAVGRTTFDLPISVHRVDWARTQYRIQSCNASESVCNDVRTESLSLSDATAATYYLKASNAWRAGIDGRVVASETEESSLFGYSIALSADGNTLAVGATNESSHIVTQEEIDSFEMDSLADRRAAAKRAADIENNREPDDYINLITAERRLQISAITRFSGAVYIFTRTGTTWTQQAFIKPAISDESDAFGSAVSFSGDGNSLAVAAVFESSDSVAIDEGATNNSASQSGAVYVFTRSGTTWSQQAYIKASNTNEGDIFGFSISLSNDGSTLAVGVPFEDSNSNIINSGGSDNSVNAAGAAYVFTRSGTTWSQQAYIKAPNNAPADQASLSIGDLFGDGFGFSVALSSDGSTLAVGAPFEDSNSQTINVDENDNSAHNAGAAYVFVRSGTTWSRQAYIKASDLLGTSNFGYDISLGGDGNTLAVGALGNHNMLLAANRNLKGFIPPSGEGSAHVFVRSGTTWSEQTSIASSGDSLALSTDGNTLAVGGVSVFVRSGTTWDRQSSVGATNPDPSDRFGTSIALSADGDTLAIGAPFEDSNGNTINGGAGNNNDVRDSGAVYIY